VFKDNEQKMSNSQYRDILMSQIHKTYNKQQGAKYNYNAYSTEEALDILGIKEINNGNN
jgi:hypothetical protein